MRWSSHIIIAGSLTFAINPLYVPVSIAGSIAPDYLETVLNRFNIPIPHRKETHYLSVWIAVFVFSVFVFDFYNVLFWLSFGGLSHVISDSLTPTGVYMGWWSRHRVVFFNGRIKNGTPEEKYFVIFIVVFSIVLGTTFGVARKHGFNPYFFNYKELYEHGLIDGYEYRKNRWKFL